MATLRFKKAELPELARYSRERIWVMPTESGLVRLGAVGPALADRAVTAYFAEVRRRGYIVQGRRFGFIDIETGRFDLIAPFSARIARANPALDEDPGLVTSDPFGEGWLLELMKVAPALLEALLDRDTFYEHLRFEQECRRLGLQPSIKASWRLAEGSPWPDELRMEIGSRAIVRGRILRLGRNLTFTPQWGRGDRWKVRCEFTQPSIAMVPAEFARPKLVVTKWQYEVIDDEGEVDGVPCYVVKVIEIEGAPPLTFYRLSIAKTDFTLRLIEEESVFDPSRRSRTPNDWGAETWIELRRPRELILDLPLFPPENRDETRVVTVAGEPEIRQEARFPDAKTMVLACESTLRHGVLRSEQTWERGLPWWRSARRLIGDGVLITGELVE